MLYRNLSPVAEPATDADPHVADFIKKLIQTLDEGSGVITWTVAGASFVVIDPGVFASTLLPKKVKAVDQSIYGPKAWEFKNPNFIKGREDLLPFVKRKTKAAESTTKKAASGVAVACPTDFSAITTTTSAPYVINNTMSTEDMGLSNRVAYLENSVHHYSTKIDHLSLELTKSIRTIENLKQINNRQENVNKILVDSLVRSSGIGANALPALPPPVNNIDPTTSTSIMYGSNPDVSMFPANDFESFPQETTTFEEMVRSLTNSIEQTGNGILPFDPSATSAIAAQSGSVAPVTQSNPLILVVDDDKGARDIIQRFLSKFGFRTDFATNGLNAVKAFKSGKVYSAVIMDLCMPYMNGVEATSQIRSVDLNIPIICVTGNTLPSESENCLKKGMNAVIHKPVRREGLFNTLGRFFFMGNNSSSMTFPPISIYQAPSSTSASSSSNELSPDLPSDFSPLNEQSSSSSAFPEGMDEN